MQVGSKFSEPVYESATATEQQAHNVEENRMYKLEIAANWRLSRQGSPQMLQDQRAFRFLCFCQWLTSNKSSGKN